MKTSFLTLAFVLSIIYSSSFAQTVYPHLNVDLIAHLAPETDQTGQDGRKYSGCWGWYQAAKNKEYAIIGTSSKTYFIDVTNPTTPIICDSVMAAHAGCTWREIKSYQNYCYVVSDDAPPNTFQIIDMQYLPDSVHVVKDDANLFERCHTLWVDGNKLYCGSATEANNTYHTMQVYSLANPAAPALLRSLEQDDAIVSVVHDMFVKNDTVYASCGFHGLYVYKFNSNNTFSQLAIFSGYVQAGYNHSSYITEDSKTLVFCDEVPENTVVKILDVHDLNNLTIKDTIRSHMGATPHNPYVIGNDWVWVSTYQDGLYIYDISDPSNVTIAGYFDTYPQGGVNDNFSGNAYTGNWGAYPYLPSKLIIANDMQNGVFLLQADAIYNGTTSIKNETKHQTAVYPNPATNKLYITSKNNHESINYEVSDILGKTYLKGSINTNEPIQTTIIDLHILTSGCYFVSLKGTNWTESHKIIVNN